MNPHSRRNYALNAARLHSAIRPCVRFSSQIEIRKPIFSFKALNYNKKSIRSAAFSMVPTVRLALTLPKELRFELSASAFRHAGIVVYY